jgi:DNA-binding SARP family transcriptional activator/tetratricopeptide (TPR) repeat protein/DNA-binding XRE family transcriptional regulator
LKGDSTAGVLAGLVRRHRLAAGLNQRELAELAGISVRALRDLERGRIHNPRARSMRRLTDALRLTPRECSSLLSALDTAAVADEPSLRVRVLGPLTVTMGGAGLDVRSSMQRDLLGLLALRHGQPVSQNEIVDVLWNDDPPRTYRNLVQVYIGRLRALLGTGHLPGHRLIRWDGRGYVLELQPDQLDLAEFDASLSSAADLRAGGDEPGVLDQLIKALSCWRGPVLVGAGSRLCHHPIAVAASQRRLAASVEVADLALAAGRPDRAITWLRAVADSEPLHEGVHARLITALAADRDQATALRLFAELRTRLADELGVDPGAEVQTAYLNVMRADDPAGSPPSTRAALPVPAQLPLAASHFTGRSRHLAELDSLFAAGDRSPVLPLALITGTAGVGKTALAVHWAHLNAAAFPDGQISVDLLGYGMGRPLPPLVVLGRFLRALGVDPVAIPTELDEAAAMYRSMLARRRLLVLLDNAASAAQVRPLLPGAPGCAVLITSRDRLGNLVAVDGAHRVGLAVLDQGEAHALLVRTLGGKATGGKAAIDELAGRCAYLPLAMRVAAASVTSHPHRTVAGYLTELAGAAPLSALNLDAGGQGAVRAAFDLSYTALPPPARLMFRRTSLFPGPDFGPSAVAAAAGCTVAEARGQLHRLCDAHLVTEQPSTRHTTHDLLRSYAREQTVSEESYAERRDAARRLVDFYVDATYEAYPLLLPRRDERSRDLEFRPTEPLRFTDPNAALNWHDAERENLLGTIRMAADRDWHVAAWQLADNLFAYFHLRRHWLDWISATSIGLESARQAGDLRAAARMHNALGVAHKQLGRFGAARKHYEQAQALAAAIGYTRFVAAMHVNIGGLYVHEGKPAVAIRHLRTALADPEYGTDPQYATITYLNLGCALVDLERHTEAEAAIDRALEFAIAVHDKQNACHAYHSLTEIALCRDDLPAARRRAHQQAELAAEIGDPLRQAAAADMLASCLVRQHTAQARRHWQYAYEIYAGLQHPLATALSEWLVDLDSIDPADLADRDRARRRHARSHI